MVIRQTLTLFKSTTIDSNKMLWFYFVKVLSIISSGNRLVLPVSKWKLKTFQQKCLWFYRYLNGDWRHFKVTGSHVSDKCTDHLFRFLIFYEHASTCTVYSFKFAQSYFRPIEILDWFARSNQQQLIQQNVMVLHGESFINNFIGKQAIFTSI